MAAVKLPADVELEDRLAFGFTAKQLALLAATAVCAYGAFLAAGSLLPGPLRLAPPVLVVAAGAGLALVRHNGLAGDQLALALVRFALAPKRRVHSDGTLPPRLRGAPRAARVAPLDIPIRRILANGLVRLADSSHCLLLVAQGSSFELRSTDEQEAFVAVFERFLNARTEAIQLSVRSERASLAPHADQIEVDASALPPGLHAAALDHAAFLRGLAAVRPLFRRRIVLTLHTRQTHTGQAQLVLLRLAAEAVELLRGAEVALEPLDGERAAALLAASLDPPGPPTGAHLTGVIHAHPHQNS